MEADPLGWNLFWLLFLLFIHALLTAAETAARTLNLNKLRRQAENQDPHAEKLVQYAEKLTQTPSGVRAGLAFVGFSSAGIVIYSYTRPLAQALGRIMPFLSGVYLSGLAGLLVMLVFASIFLLFGTVMPRQIASHRARKTAHALYRLASFFHALFLPLAKAINFLSTALVRLLGINPDEEVVQLTEDEIRMLVDVGEEKGAIQETEREMIENVFEFNNLTATDCMTHRTDVYAVWVDDTVDETVRMIEETGLSRFPVYDEDLDHIIGTVSTRDFLLNQQRESPLPLREVLRPARYVPESAKTDALFRDMQRNKYHMAIVVDEYGGTSGLITMEDLIEEIVGNIYDESDPQAQQDLIVLSEGHYKVAGGMQIDAFNDASGLSLPLDEEYDTMGGMMLNLLSSIPDEGSQPEIDAYQLHFKVLSVADRRIEWVEVRRQSQEVDESV